MKLAHIADRVAAEIFEPVMLTQPPNSLDLDKIRVACDVATGSELATAALDRLTFMVEWRLDYLPRKWVDTHPKVALAVALHRTESRCGAGEEE